MQEKSYPLVSVVMITYAHENYILQAIEGVLMQEYQGEIELIISNDKSPDGTDVIIKKTIEYHPRGNWIKYTRHEKNLGMMPNFIWAQQQAMGKYIAICEGDDYWTDPLKLQKQVDFLEANINFVACQHDRNLMYNDGSLVIEKSNLYIFTQCFMFRNVLNEEYFAYSKEVFNGDTFLEYYLRLFGNIKYLDFNGAVYRISGTGVYTSLDEKTKKKKALFTYKQILKLQSVIATDKSTSEAKIIQSKITEYQFSVLICDKLNLKEMFRYFYYIIKYQRLRYLLEYKRIFYLFFK